ncbi:MULTISPECIES: helicase-related protein [Micrococcus]|uniref:helicase-related protein n=3 Tax=Micrococcus luteus TaxID=1270 RepID=UPI0019D19EC8|nr:helicase-related protein [Micrococcus luteus]MBN6767058.1 helicase [Micrococcus luteus]MBN6827350.1 helicase [Micrococcus luteus]MBN6845458.1 helicase [Micrococcus luteus]MBN6861603.1 helicase [Micrococcus luteus]MBN6863525.1 helicase [Micrococcus luteus]
MLPIDHMPQHLTPEQAAAYRHLRGAYVGPEGGENETLTGIPSLQYIAGMLFPIEDEMPEEQTTSDVEEGDLEESIEPLAEDWRPSSAAISFVTDASTLRVHLGFGCYQLSTNGDREVWSRSPSYFGQVEFTPDGPNEAIRLVSGIEVEVGCRWRQYGPHRLLTVHVRNRSRVDPALPAREARHAGARLTMYQVDLAVETVGGVIHDYDPGRNIDTDEESEELRLRYRKRRTFAVGHGLAARWEPRSAGDCTAVWLDSMPAHVVRDVKGRSYPPGHPAAAALSLDTLASIDDDPEGIGRLLDAFVGDFASWVASERGRIDEFGGSRQAAALRLVERSESVLRRMQEGVRVLTEDSLTRRAFSLAMRAMALQMRQISAARSGINAPTEPSWRPFQLGFLLTAIASTVDERHDDRELVDLIWFPTGGGKTEAYLGLAAVEMFLRRLRFGARGAGTAVITRYTLRLLTSQQFQRSASLICAMEILRRQDPALRGMPEFTIGLWVGNSVTPGTREEAQDAWKRLLKATSPSDVNMFQLTHCPWCLTPLLPARYTPDEDAYGVACPAGRVLLRCVDASCPFSSELPVVVVDEDIYQDPPTFLLGTVDKFAQLQFKPGAGRLLGLGTSFRPPSLLIQDELHLLSGPLGTTVAAFEAAMHVLLSRRGTRPKVVASTATIRASAEQIRGLYGREVALYPPAGLDEESSYFSQEDTEGHGRLYLGVMPQSLPQATALVAVSSPLFELPEVTTEPGAAADALDRYWTSVLYHNSLRELGRTATLVSDDVNSRLDTRAARLGLDARRIPSSRIIELTSRKTSTELRSDLGRLEAGHSHPDAADAVLSSNMLSVGIDVSRLSLMLMVGQPKTTSEYIQATSRVGRGRVKGIVVSLFRANRARDRSHFESFQSFHEALYRAVEPTSVTPWSSSSRAKSLPGIVVTLARQGIPDLGPNEAAGRFRKSDPHSGGALREMLDELLARVDASDPAESHRTKEELVRLVAQWDHRASDPDSPPLQYQRRRFTKRNDSNVLLKDFAEAGPGWVTANSMRSVEPNSAIEIREPFVREASSD